MKLRVRWPKVPTIEEIDLDDDTPWIQLVLLLASRIGTAPHNVKVLSGFPPRPVLPDDELCMLMNLFKNGDMITVQVGEGIVKQGSTDGKYVPPADERGIFFRRNVPGDNSCLFHSCAYILKDKSRTLGPSLRQECAEVVVANRERFTAALLGQPPAQYAEWILKPTSWGGAVELMILSFVYQTEIIALDIESGTMQRFGETEGYSVRGFVVYTGKHYDAIGVSNPIQSGNSERDDQVLFNPRDDRILERAIRFVKEECHPKRTRDGAAS
jgi:ubiquitin thioesterase OTU1